MKKLFSVLTDDLEHCIITGDANVAIHHVFNGSNRKLSEKYGSWFRSARTGTTWPRTASIWTRPLTRA